MVEEVKATGTEAKDTSEVEVPKEYEKLVTELDKMSVLDISKFITFLEKHWGVSAAARAVAAAAAGWALRLLRLLKKRVNMT